MDVELSSARGLADEAPVGGAVAGSTEAGGLDEGLQQDGAVAHPSKGVKKRCPAAVWARVAHFEARGRRH